MSLKSQFTNGNKKRSLILLGLKGAEIALNLYFMRSLKVAVEPVGRYNGSVLKRALIISKDLEFNYQFGRDTKDLRKIFSLTFVPSVVASISRIYSFNGFMQTLLTIFSVLCMCDTINTNQSGTCYYIMLCVQGIRVADQIKDMWCCVQELSIKSVPTIISVIRVPKHKNNLMISALKLTKQVDSTDDSSGSSKKQATELAMEVSQPKPKILKKRIQCPKIEMKVKMGNTNHVCTLDDPYKFDEAFKEVQGVDECTLLHMKIYYCNVVYKIVRNRDKNQSQLLQFLTQLIMKYQATLMMNTQLQQ